MHRTQIHLDDRHIAALDRASRETGASRAELIRRAIEVVYDNVGERRLPRSIGSISNGTIDASTVKDWIRSEWAKDFERKRARNDR